MSTSISVLNESGARARSILEQHGIRPTSQRVKVAELLLVSPRHMTAEQILGCLRESDDRVSKATVYNTLNLFVAQGLAREIHADPERCVYDSTMAPHHHFQNVDTGEMIDIHPQDLSFARLPELPPGTEIESVDVVIRVRRKA
jgi:Fur family iron response transcriptional regulator